MEEAECMWSISSVSLGVNFFFSLYRMMVPQKIRTGQIQILALIRLRATRHKEFYQDWWAQQIKLLLTCLAWRSDYWLSCHLTIYSHRLFTYFPAHWPAFYYTDFLNVASQLPHLALKVTFWERTLNTLYLPFLGGSSSEFPSRDCTLRQLSRGW